MFGPTTSKTLLEKLRNGDEISYDEFYYRYRDMIISLGTLKGLSPTDCDDLVQEVMITFFRKASNFSFDSSKGRFRTWLGRIIQGKIIDYFRRHKQNCPLTEEISASCPDENALPPDELFQITLLEEMRLVAYNEALELLKQQVSPQTYLIFEYYALQHHCASECLARFDISKNQRYKAKSKCLAMLRDILSTLNGIDPELELNCDNL